MKTVLIFIVIGISFLPFKRLKSTESISTKKDSIPNVLYKLLPKLKEYVDRDTIFYPYDSIQEEDTSHVMAVGRFIDGKDIHAMDTCVKDSSITFYKYNAPLWTVIGKEKIPNFLWFRFKDLDGDGRNEIVAETGGNMNGNVGHTIYYASRDKEQIHFAGSFFGNYEIAPNKQIHYIYEGSWYADNILALYEWRNEKLIPLRQVTLRLKKADMKHDAQWIIYKENPTFDKDSLVQKFKKTYRGKKLYDFWENFFDKESSP